MEFQPTRNGLFIPKQKPKRQYGPLEIDNPKDRDKAANALRELFYAMGLHWPKGGIGTAEYHAIYEFRQLQWDLLATMLLGEDVPECEVLT
jgi:hypothetical protein